MEGDSPNPIVHIPKSGEEPGGSGGTTARGDAALELQAAKQRWNITKKQRDDAVARILERMLKTDDDRALASLAKALGEYDKLNLAAETGTGMGGDVTVRVVYDSPNPRNQG